MALKTFNVEEKTYKEFSKHCRKEGISMSKKVENFIRSELEKLKGVRKMPEIEQIDEKKIEKDFSKEHPLMRYC
jgi:ribosome-binding factor A